jgi:hypothetical protein
MLISKMRAFKTIVLLAVLSAASMAQSLASRVQLRGIVVDAHGLPVPNASISAKNVDFGEPRIAVSDATGNFYFNALAAGTYMLSAQGTGLATKKPVRVQITVGSSQQVRLTLSPTAVTASTTVSARGATVEGNTVPPAINKQDPKNSNTIAGLTVTYLPNRNRDFTQFQQLASGAVDDAQGGTSILGQSSTYVTASIDGAEINDPLFGGESGGTRDHFFLPQVVVREFQIVKSGATAEVGGTSAGFINIASKEGSNKFRGEAFYIGRPPAFTSHDAFGHELDNMQNEFGGSIAGPIRKDKAFFLVGFEQDFLRTPTWTQFAPQASGVTIPSSLQALEEQTRERAHPSALFARLDFVLSKQNTLALQTNFNRADSTDILSSSTRTLATPDHSRKENGHSTWARANLSSLLGTSMVNQLLAQWSREAFRSSPTSGSVEDVINGFGILGGASDASYRYGTKRYQTNEDLALTRGTSAFNFGVGYIGTPIDYSGVEFTNGQRGFNSLNDYLAGNTRRFRQAFILGDPRMRGTLQRFGTYVTSRFEISPKLTVNAGLRLDMQWNPQTIRAAVTDDLNQWQPRLGIAWNPRSTLVVRASAGLYDAPTPAVMFSRVFAENGANVIVADSYFDPALLPLVAASLSHQLSTFPAVAPSRVFSVEPSFRNPRSFQFAVNVEKELNRSASLTTGYVRNSTWALPRLVDANLSAPSFTAEGLPVFGVRPDPAIGQLLTYESRAHSSYDGWLTTLNVQLPKRSSLAANYTLSRTRDDNPLATPLSELTLLDPLNPRLDEGYSTFDARHVFTLSGVINLPAGFKCNPLLIARSGLPYTPVVGFDLQNDANDWNDRALINGVVARRNSLHQPGFFNLDLRFVKDFALKGEGHHLDLFLDVLNVAGNANRNFGSDALSVFGTPASPVFSAGQPLFAPNTARIGGARQVQFTARIVAF